MARVALTIALLLSLSGTSRAETRVWTDKQNGQQLKADFLTLKDGQVRLKRRPDGRILTVPLERLSDDDQAYIRTATGAPAPEKDPSKPAPGTTKPGAPAAPAGTKPVPGTVKEPLPVAPGKPEAPESIEDLPLVAKAPVSAPPLLEVSNVRIETKTCSAVTYASMRAPYVCVDSRVFSLADGKLLGQLPPRGIIGSDYEAISPDGKLAARSQNNQEGVVVYEVATGKKLHELALGKGNARAMRLEFTGPQRLVWVGEVGSSATNVLSGWDLNDGGPKELYHVALLAVRGAAVRPDGKVVAINTGDELALYDAETGAKQAVVIANKNIANKLGNFAFSPDGSELACAGGRGLVIFDMQGQLVYHATMNFWAVLSPELPHAIQFLPNGSGILLDGQWLFDRETGLVVWKLERNRLTGPSAYVLNNEQVCVSSTGGGVRLVSFPIPRDAIKQAKAALTSPSALLKPGDGVKVEVVLGKLRFDDGADLEKRFAAIMTERLERGGFKVANDAKAVLRFSYAEAADTETLPVYEGIGATKKDTGVRLTQTLITAEASLVQGEQKLFSRPFDYGRAGLGLLTALTNDKQLRDGRLSVVWAELGRLELPQLVDETGKGLLPVVSTAK